MPKNIPIPNPVQYQGQEIEIYSDQLALGQIRHAIFDFDGTLSLIRAGWQQVMVDLFVDLLAQTPTREDRANLTLICRDFITRLTGKQTIYQMFQLAEEIAQRGAEPLPALEYKHMYLDLLQNHIAHRLESLQSKREKPQKYMIRGSIELLEGFKRRAVTCHLASGTDRGYVIAEAELLGLTHYFEDRIYGALEDYTAFSKKMIIDHILAENRLYGAELMAIGDGYVEIENIKGAGGLAVAIASLEEPGGGWDLWKKRRLLQVGADILVPDWREAELLLTYLFDE